MLILAAWGALAPRNEDSDLDCVAQYCKELGKPLQGANGAPRLPPLSLLLMLTGCS